MVARGESSRRVARGVSGGFNVIAVQIGGREGVGDAGNFVGVNRDEGSAFSIFSIIFQGVGAAGGARGDAVSIGTAVVDGFSIDLGAREGVEGGDSSTEAVGAVKDAGGTSGDAVSMDATVVDSFSAGLVAGKDVEGGDSSVEGVGSGDEGAEAIGAVGSAV